MGSVEDNSMFEGLPVMDMAEQETSEDDGFSLFDMKLDL